MRAKSIELSGSSLLSEKCPMPTLLLGQRRELFLTARHTCPGNGAGHAHLIIKPNISCGSTLGDAADRYEADSRFRDRAYRIQTNAARCFDRYSSGDLHDGAP